MYCTKCGEENPDEAVFCTHCGQSMQRVQAPQRDYAPPRTGTPMRTTTLILGLIAATMLLFGGCTATITGGFFSGVEEVFGTEMDDPNDSASTTEDVLNAGLFAMFIAVCLYIGAGLAKIALKTSLALLIVNMLMLIRLVSIDTTSLFAVSYYLTTPPSITTTVPQFGQALAGNRFAEGMATKLSSAWAGSHEEVFKVPFLRSVVVILVGASVILMAIAYIGSKRTRPPHLTR